MIRSLFSAVSGLTSHQFAMDVIGNNIANIDTVGFKTSSVDFSEAFSQTTRIADESTPIGLEVGLGTRVVGTVTNFTQGAMKRTDVPSDVAIAGNGYFIVNTLNATSVSSSTGNTYLTRAGDFVVDINGYLRTPDGFYVQGYSSDASINTSTATLATALNETVSGGNGSGFGTVYLDASGNVVTSSTVGAQSAVAGDYNADLPPTAGVTNTDFTTTLSSIKIPSEIVTASTSGGAPYTVEAVTNYSIGTGGAITVVGASGTSVIIGYLPLATVTNNSGLSTVGSGYYQGTKASGEPTAYQASTGTTGSLQSGALELSNSDVADQFSEMIIIQNGYNANAKVITTSSQMLQIAVNMVS